MAAVEGRLAEPHRLDAGEGHDGQPPRPPARPEQHSPRGDRPPGVRRPATGVHGGPERRGEREPEPPGARDQPGEQGRRHGHGQPADEDAPPRPRREPPPRHGGEIDLRQDLPQEDRDLSRLHHRGQPLALGLSAVRRGIEVDVVAGRGAAAYGAQLERLAAEPAVQRRLGRRQRLDAAGRNGAADAGEQAVVGAQVRAPAGQGEAVELQQEPGDRQHAEQHERRRHQRYREQDAGQDRVGHAEPGQPFGGDAERQSLRGGPQHRLEKVPVRTALREQAQGGRDHHHALVGNDPQLHQLAGRDPQQQAVAGPAAGREPPRLPPDRPVVNGLRRRPDGSGRRRRPDGRVRAGPRRPGGISRGGPAREHAGVHLGHRVERQHPHHRLGPGAAGRLDPHERDPAEAVQGVLHEVDVLDALVGDVALGAGQDAVAHHHLVRRESVAVDAVVDHRGDDHGADEQPSPQLVAAAARGHEEHEGGHDEPLGELRGGEDPGQRMQAPVVRRHGRLPPRSTGRGGRPPRDARGRSGRRTRRACRRCG